MAEHGMKNTHNMSNPGPLLLCKSLGEAARDQQLLVGADDSQAKPFFFTCSVDKAKNQREKHSF